MVCGERFELPWPLSRTRVTAARLPTVCLPTQMVPAPRLERGRVRTSPSTMRVFQFHHAGMVHMDGFEPSRYEQRGLSTPGLPVSPHVHGRDGGIRTLTERVLSALPLPLGYIPELPIARFERALCWV